MPIRILLLFLVFTGLQLSAGDPPRKQPFGTLQAVSFTENKGQISDQDGHPRTDVLFGGSANGISFHMRSDGLSYQVCSPQKTAADTKSREQDLNIYRVDVSWPGCNQQAKIVSDAPLPGYSNFYLPACPNGALYVKSYEGLTYQQIYRGIDLHYYSASGSLKYDFLIAPFADYRQIRMLISGAKKIKLLSDGAVVISTPFGDIREEAPLVYQDHHKIKSAWLVEGNSLSFRLENYDRTRPLVIDPVVRVWGTYYGGNLDDQANGCATSGTDVYIAGWSGSTTYTNIATSGAHQATLSGSTLDAFLAKFDQNGARIWGTYYGDTGIDRGFDCAADSSGNVYLCGTAASGTAHATAGSHQPAHGGSDDAFLVKFNSSGVRLWGTYYGGTGDEDGNSCFTDPAGNVFLAGSTNLSSGTVIATVGSHQATFGGNSDGYIVKFSTAGVRLWGSYYGGSGTEELFGGAADPSGNVFIGGRSTGSGNAVVSSGAHQTTQGGNGDALLVKFSAGGARLWASLYGGSGADVAHCVASDPSGNLFVTGTTQSTLGTIFATSGAYQGSHAGTSTYDAFVAKFDGAGARSWSTYYGDLGQDQGLGCSSDQSGNVYISGMTSSTMSTAGTVMATAASHQTVLNNNGYGGGDAYLAKFTPTGTRDWATYYGGFSGEAGFSVSTHTTGAVYMCGMVTGGNTLGSQDISSVNGFQQGHGGGVGDGFLARFADCNFPAPPVNATPPSQQTVCPGYAAIFSATSAGTVRWYETMTSVPILGTGTSITVPLTSAGTYTYYASSTTCAENSTRTAVTITVVPGPSVTAGSGTTCSGSPFVISPSGAVSYSVTGGSFTVSPLVTTQYSVTGTGTNGCVSPTPFVITVTALPLPVLTTNSGYMCIGGVYQIQPGGAVSYSVSGGSFTVSPSSNTTYTVTGTDANGCISPPAVITVTVNNVFPTVTVNSGTLCSGSTFTLNPSGATYYTYSSGASTVSPPASATYTVTGFLTNSCSATAISSVTVIPLPLAVAATPSNLCLGQSATLTASGAPSYSWSTGATVSSVVVTPQIQTYYMVTGIDAVSGCVAKVVSTVAVLPLPGVTLVSSHSLICPGESVTLTATGPGTFTWSTNASGNTSIVTPTVTTSYSVTAAGANGCTATAAVKQNVDFCLTVATVPLSGQMLSVYPNPNKGTFIIETILARDYTILNALGQDLHAGTLPAGKTLIVLPELPAGVYLIRLSGGGAQDVIRMIRE